MAHKGKEASIGIECLFLVGGGGDGDGAIPLLVGNTEPEGGRGDSGY